VSRVDEAGRLLTVDGLLQVTEKKCILHVKLTNGLATGGGDAEDDMNGGRFDNRTERLVVVDAVALSEAADHPAGLVTGDGAVGVEFMLINPLARHNVGTWRSGYAVQGAMCRRSGPGTRLPWPPATVGQQGRSCNSPGSG